MEEPTSGPQPQAPDTDPPVGAAPGHGEPEGSDPEGRVSEGPPEPAGPQPLGVGLTPTGHAAVDAGLARLADADHLAADGHLPVYEDVHRGLRDALAALDQRPGPPAPTATTNDLRS
ncbi:hypothetical protein [Streptomyces pinistramenti]|uniref:hypothetical protein n=1 Tax=Streptomyces pinistramenti TaxID=2884812 RepID=UPI001D05E420|nr:hypothetical protein [Streptomyces pinistramenti]MCB5909915.1 hypothetical protein [Streptomyces pinistramenti]